MIRLKRVGLIWAVCLSACGDPVQQHIDTIIEGRDGIDDAKLSLNMAKGTAIEPVIHAFEDHSLSTRARLDLADALYRLYLREDDGRIFASLVAALEDPVPEVRAGVARAVGNLRKNEAVGPLLARLQAETDADMRLEILNALEFMSTNENGGTDQVTPHLFDDDQKTSFAAVLSQMVAGSPPQELRKATVEWLEILAQDLARDVENLILAADVIGAEAMLQSGLELVPDSRNLNQKLGRLYFENGEEDRGIKHLELHGMVARATELPSAPTLDGVLDDPAWQQVQPLTAFYQCVSRLSALPIDGRSEAYIGYVGDTLYVAVKGYEASTEGLVAESTERDGRVHADDCLEVFFDTNRDALSYFQFIINTLGTVSDTHYGRDRPGSDWNGSITIGTTVADTFWVAEVAIPVATLDGATINKGDIWGFNVARVRTGNASEYGQWVPTYGLALRPDRFGYLVFE